MFLTRHDITLGRGLALLRATEVAPTLEWRAYVLLWGFVCAAPWADALSQRGDRVVTSWFGILAAALACVRLLAVGRARRPSVPHVWMLALVGWSGLSLLWTLDRDSTV